MDQSQIKLLSTLSNRSISVFTQILSKFDELNVLSQFERCAGLLISVSQGSYHRVIDFEGAFILQKGLQSARQIIVEDQGVNSGSPKSYSGEQTADLNFAFLMDGWMIN